MEHKRPIFSRKKQEIAPPPEQASPPLPPLTADPERGLTTAQAEQRQAAGLANCAVTSPTKSEGQIVRENIFTFFNLVFVVLAACLAMVGSFANMTFLGVVVCNTVIGIYQQIRSKRTIDKLTLVSAHKVRCVRDGALVELPATELVRDDIVEFSAGDQIGADAVLRTGAVQANEALITGEADPINKEPGDTLRSGSFVMAGHGRAQLTRVGAESYANKLTTEAKTNVNTPKSEMMRSLDNLIRFIGIALVPLGIVLFLKQYQVLELGLKDSVNATVAALIGMIPEGLYLLTSVALAVSMIRLAQRKVLAQDMNCIETLARVDMLCVDKTGTITEAQMEAGDPIPLDPDACPPEKLAELLRAFYGDSEPDNDTARALIRRFGGNSDWVRQASIPFNSAYKWSAATFAGHGSFVVGAPEFVLGARYGQFSARVEPYLAKGYRILLVAGVDAAPDPAKGLNPETLHPLALLPVTNRIRPEAPKTFRYFAQQGVAVRVISGDNPLAVSEVARQAGVENADQYVDATTLRTEEDITRAAGQYTVFGRVTPAQKRQLIKAMQKAGHTVAMTGDGVNDVLALKDADCGIAMASGAQAASQVAQLVLLNSDFSGLPAVVAEGRRVINNIQRSASLFLVKNIFSFLFSFLSLFLVVPYPLQPLQLTLISATTIGIPAFFLALEPNHDRVSGHFILNVLRAAFPGGLTNLALVLGVEAFVYAFVFSNEVLYTISTGVLLAVGLGVLWRVCTPFTPP
ncbi:MAG: cation-translocating P-type ATPase, partial [Gemmiger sp.]|nr:cation-translocating P-type ATPase [Gemmiger sp.]